MLTSAVLLAFSLGPAEMAIFALVVIGLLVSRALSRNNASEVRRACPECRQVNRVERAQLGKRVRCRACGSILYPNEHPAGGVAHVQNVNIQNTVGVPPASNQVDAPDDRSQLGG